MSFRADEPDYEMKAVEERPRQLPVEIEVHAERLNQLGMVVDQLESRLRPITQRSSIPDARREPPLERAVEEVSGNGPLTQELQRQNRELGALLERLAQLAAMVEV